MTNQSTESIHLRLNTEIIKEIDIFKDEYFFTSRSDAMRYLLALGLKHQEITTELLSHKIEDIKKKTNDI